MYTEALRKLRAAHKQRKADASLSVVLDAQGAVLARYGPMFTPDGIDALTREGIRDFLMIRNNRHWSGLQRMGPAITKDMAALKQALRGLLDESIPVGRRLDQILPGRRERRPVAHLGKAVLTPILLIAHPRRYGVWNGTSEGAMRALGIWPDFDRGTTIGARYEIVNSMLIELAEELSVDLWTLDALWWMVTDPDDKPETETSREVEARDNTLSFGLERHLHDFLIDHWESTRLGKEWDLDEEGGDITGYGAERRTPVGRIDLLAHHKTEPRWLVVELKRARASDKALGQVQRYMGWVKQELAKPGETVEGLIIAFEEDEQLRFALKATRGIRFMRYEVDFRLVET